MTAIAHFHCPKSSAFFSSFPSHFKSMIVLTRPQGCVSYEDYLRHSLWWLNHENHLGFSGDFQCSRFRQSSLVLEERLSLSSCQALATRKSLEQWIEKWIRRNGQGGSTGVL
jgi:hypothetical protein